MKFFLIAGEPSGDRLGAALINGFDEVLTQRANFIGIGGENMTQTGFKSMFPMEEIAIMGVGEILSKFFFLKKRIGQIANAVIQAQPDALITIDLPEFNLRVANIVRKKSNIPIIHYVAPTVWAWRPRRAEKMAGFIDHVLAVLPFEPPYMVNAGMSCDFVGHPTVEEPVATASQADAFRTRYNVGRRPLLLCLPGSRKSEVKRLTPIFCKALTKIKASLPEIRFVLVASATTAEEVQVLVSECPEDIIVIDPRDETPDQALAIKRAAFRAADVALAASGTVSLELAASNTPMVIGYDMGWLSRQVIGSMLITDTVTLVNLVSETRFVPELLGRKCTSENLANSVMHVLKSPSDQLLAMKDTMKRLGRGLAPPGQRAAISVLKSLRVKSTL